MREKLIRNLKLLKEEIDKRDQIKDTLGVDLSNYENKHTEVAISATISSIMLFHHNHRTKEQLKELIEWWLYDVSPKVCKVRGKRYKVKSARAFVNFLLDV
ncbi:MAG: hypothetical protein M0R03_03635 [Novosphingobium sp.]|nr:hypothetical protein [Novosphingobium sp.]